MAAARPPEKTNADLEPVRSDNLRRIPLSVTFEKTFAATRGLSSAAIRESREIFS
jgi:hypothetical protein